MRISPLSAIKHGLVSPNSQGDTAMLTKSKIALSFALVLGAASAAMAATKHPVHRPVPAAAYQDYGYMKEHGQFKKVLGEDGAILIQDRDWAATNGVAPEGIR
jgi:hypothetical protein